MRLTGATRNLSMIERMESRIADESAREGRGPTNPRDTLNAEDQKPSGPTRYPKTGPPICTGWTPGIRGLDPRCTRPQDPASLQTRTKDHAGSGTLWDSGLRGIQDFVGFKIRDFVGFKTSRDPGLRGIQDFAGSGTLWDSRLHETQDFVGPRTRPDNRTPTYIRSESCSVVFSKRTQTVRINLKHGHHLV